MNNDRQQFHQYLKNEQPPPTSNHSMQEDRDILLLRFTASDHSLLGIEK
jgi:hypothetical protein